MARTKMAPRWIAQDVWCGVDLTNEHPDWVGERCRLPRGHLTQHSPIFGWPSHGTDELWAKRNVEPVEWMHDPERVNYIFDSMERELILSMWERGHAPMTPPYWDMWVERHPGGIDADFDQAHFKVSIIGLPVVMR